MVEIQKKKRANNNTEHDAQNQTPINALSIRIVYILYNQTGCISFWFKFTNFQSNIYLTLHFEKQ